MNKLINLIRADLSDFMPYRSARDEVSEGKIWLNANESPFDFEPLKGFKMNRYPEKQPIKLITKLADIYQVNLNQIVISRGSDEAIDLLIRLFCYAGKDAVMVCPPTFDMYSVYARIQGAHVVEAPLNKEDDYQLDLPLIMSRWQPNVKIIFLCSPNNPTGNLLKSADILTLCKKLADKSIIVVDEAYIDFSARKSLTHSINQYPNLVILRTASKAYGLASARCGLLLADKDLVSWILKIIAPYPLSSLVSNVVLKSLSASRLIRIQQQIQCTQAERERLFVTLKDLVFIKKVWPSEANYLLVEMHDAKKIMNKCKAHGIVLRCMWDKSGLENCIRISIGLPEENTQLINILKDIA